MRTHFLIVDDSRDFLTSATRLLEAEGMRVVGVLSAPAASAFLAATAVDVILVDVDLGEDDGVAVAAGLAAQSPTSAVVLISSHDELREMLLPAGVAGFLPKAELGVAAVQNLVDLAGG